MSCQMSIYTSFTVLSYTLCNLIMHASLPLQASFHAWWSYETSPSWYISVKWSKTCLKRILSLQALQSTDEKAVQDCLEAVTLITEASDDGRELALKCSAIDAVTKCLQNSSCNKQWAVRLLLAILPGASSLMPPSLTFLFFIPIANTLIKSMSLQA